jgi:hypothetical protein
MAILPSAVNYIGLVPENITVKDEKGYVFSGFVIDKRVYWEVDHSILQFVLAINIEKEILSFCIYLDTQGNNVDYLPNSDKLV